MMKCIIQCARPLRNKFEVITLNDDKIYYDDGNSYEKIILDDSEKVEEICSQLYEIIFSWKQEYIGEKVYDGEKYLIEVDVNHKRKKYKIQNKYPDNWEEFLEIKRKIVDLNEG